MPSVRNVYARVFLQDRSNDNLHESTLILIALVLFGITLLVNALARLLVWRAAGGPAGSVRG